MKINTLFIKILPLLWYGKEGASTLRFLQKMALDGSITILDKNINLKIENFNGKMNVLENYFRKFRSVWLYF